MHAASFITSFRYLSLFRPAIGAFAAAIIVSIFLNSVYAYMRKYASLIEYAIAKDAAHTAYYYRMMRKPHFSYRSRLGII